METTPESTSTLRWAVDQLSRHWLFSVVCGLLLIGLGAMVAVVPHQSVRLCAVAVGVGLIIAGQARLFLAFGDSEEPPRVRLALGIVGLVAMGVGVLCLVDTVQTLLVLEVMLGLWWLAEGVIDLATHAFLRRAPRPRAEIGRGLVALAAGCVLLLAPKTSFTVLVVMTCLWLVGVGIAFVALGVHARIDRPAAPA